MLTPARVSWLSAVVIFSCGVAGMLFLERSAYRSTTIDHAALTSSIALAALFAALLAVIGIRIGLRIGRSNGLEARHSLAIPIGYLVAVALIGLIPVGPVTVAVPGAISRAELFGAALVVVGAVVLPGVIAYVVATKTRPLQTGGT